MRAAHLGEARKRINRVYELMEYDASEDEVQVSLNYYEIAFHKFVDAHKAHLQIEDRKEIIALAKENYEKEKQSKFLLKVDIIKRRSKIKLVSKKSKFSSKSNRSVRSGTSLASSKSSAREKRKILEETKLKIKVLEEKQNLECRIEKEEAVFKRKELQIEEERSRRRAKWSRKVDILEVGLEMKKATVPMELSMEEKEIDDALKGDRSKVAETELTS